MARQRFLWAGVLGCVLTTGLARAGELKHRWVYVSQNLLVEKNVETAIDVMRRAKKAGYTGMVLADYKFNILGRMPERYFKHVGRVKGEAKRLGLDIIPCIFPIGYASGILAHDPNLAAGLPVRKAPFVVRGRAAGPTLDGTALANGDFEQTRGNAFAGWDWQDKPGQISFADRTVVKRGRVSLRMQAIGRRDPKHGHGRIQQRLIVKPFRAYHLSVWIRTRNFEAAGQIRAAVLSEAVGSHTYRHWRIQPTQDWRQYHLVFNSLAAHEVRLYLGVWKGRGGTLWWDDCRLEAGDLANVIRRAECPLTVTGADDKTTYQEGRDYETISDPKLGHVRYPGTFDDWHPPPKLTLTRASRIRDGETLLISYFHPTIIHRGQIGCSLTSPKVFEIMADQMRRVHGLFNAPGYFMSYDEIRVANWEMPAEGRRLTAGQRLAEHVRRAVDIAREVAPKAALYVWSDMFDPNHNARDGYYLVNGTFAGSWEGLAKDVVIVPWYFGQRDDSLKWFADRGHKQVIAGYYDSRPERVRDWLTSAGKVDGVIGVMYTTWRQRYDDVEAFLGAVNGFEPSPHVGRGGS